MQCSLLDTKKGGERGRERISGEEVWREEGGSEGGSEVKKEGGVGKAASLQRCAGSPHALGSGRE